MKTESKHMRAPKLRTLAGVYCVLLVHWAAAVVVDGRVTWFGMKFEHVDHQANKWNTYIGMLGILPAVGVFGGGSF